jgi:tRNA uridine 5-carbamoylmethylation protein Kti12
MEAKKIHDLDIVLLGGLYGSGKTIVSKKYFIDKGRYRVSRSELRKLIFEMTNFGKPWKEEYFTEETDFIVKHVERKLIEQFLHDRKKVLVINTFVSEKSRKKFVSTAKEMKKTIGIIFLNTPIKKCLENNEKSPTKVAVQVINSLNNQIKLPVKSEGFDEVLIINDQAAK